MSRLRRALRRLREGEAGLTLMELIIAASMGVILLAVAGTMVISATRSQPEVSKRAQNISTARWVLERLTREIRNGVAVEAEKATSSEVSFRAFVRRTSCGSGGTPASTAPAIQCQVTYKCTTTSCSRTETAPGVFEGGTPRTIFTGIDDANVFSYSPSAPEATYIGVTLHIPNPEGPADITVSDGASLRNATLQN